MRDEINIGWLLKLEHSESNRSNFETNSVTNREPMQIRDDWCDHYDVAEPRFLCDNSSKSIPDTLKAIELDSKRVCQPGESCKNQVGSQLLRCSQQGRHLRGLGSRRPPPSRKKKKRKKEKKEKEKKEGKKKERITSNCYIIKCCFSNFSIVRGNIEK